VNTSPPKLDLTKPVTTRDGRAVRILCTDRKADDWTVVGLVTEVDGKETLYTFLSDGKYSKAGTSRADLINPKKKLYLLVWEHPYKEGYTVTSYNNDSERTQSIATCKKQGWKVNKTFEIEVD
jgi:hypothetical protein